MHVLLQYDRTSFLYVKKCRNSLLSYNIIRSCFQMIHPIFFANFINKNSKLHIYQQQQEINRRKRLHIQNLERQIRHLSRRLQALPPPQQSCPIMQQGGSVFFFWKHRFYPETASPHGIEQLHLHPHTLAGGNRYTMSGWIAWSQVLLVGSAHRANC